MSWHKVTSFIVNILETFLIQKVIVYHNTLNKFINMNIHCIETFAFNEKATKLCFWEKNSHLIYVFFQTDMLKGQLTIEIFWHSILSHSLL